MQQQWLFASGPSGDTKLNITTRDKMEKENQVKTVNSYPMQLNKRASRNVMKERNNPRQSAAAWFLN